jgi:hypothetical protein
MLGPSIVVAMKMYPTSFCFVRAVVVLTVPLTVTMMVNEGFVHAFPIVVPTTLETRTFTRPHCCHHYYQLARGVVLRLDGTNDDDNNKNDEDTTDLTEAFCNGDAFSNSIEFQDDDDNSQGPSNYHNKPLLSNNNNDVQAEDDLPWFDFSQIQEINYDENSILPQQLPLFTSSVIFVTSVVGTLYLYYVGIFGLSSSPSITDPPNITL